MIFKILIAGFFLCPIWLKAQSAILKNPDIVWAAEIEQDWEVDIFSLDTESEQGITTIKLFRKENDPEASIFLAELVYKAAFHRHMPIYQDAGCSIPIIDLKEFFIRTDTALICFPEPDDPPFFIVSSEWLEPLKEIKGWRLRQILTYNRKTSNWDTSVEAMAPLVIERNIEGDTIGNRPAFWFRPKNKRPNLNSNNIVWVKQTVNDQPKTRIPDPGEIEKPLKGANLPHFPMTHLFETLKTDFKVPFFTSPTGRPLSQVERVDLTSGRDTIISFDPETYEEKEAVVYRWCDGFIVDNIRLVQTWYWNDRRQRLSICLDSVAPMMNVYDSDRTVRYQKPVFYQFARQY